MKLRQVEARSDDGRTIMTWLPANNTPGLGSVISLDGESGYWRINWRSHITLDEKEVKKKRFTNSATRAADGSWQMA